MPELPEVETVRLGLILCLVKQKINKVIVRQPKLRWPVPTHLPSKLKNQVIMAISRRGKYLLFHFKRGTLIVHLGMSGRLLVLPKMHERYKHEHVVLELSNQKALCFIDPRRFGAVLWTEEDDPLQHPLLNKLGREPLDRKFSVNYLWEKSRTRKLTVKQFIMDGHIVVGVGNIYANEALFVAGIRPARSANSLTQKECDNLAKAIKHILRKALRKSGTTIRDYVTSRNTHGHFGQHLKVYGRSGEPCVVCGNILQEVRLGQRSSVFCPKCQR